MDATHAGTQAAGDLLDRHAQAAQPGSLYTAAMHFREVNIARDAPTLSTGR